MDSRHFFPELEGRPAQADQQRQDEQRVSNDQPRKTVRKYLQLYFITYVCPYQFYIHRYKINNHSFTIF
jgi:hypothetical protein